MAIVSVPALVLFALSGCGSDPAPPPPVAEPAPPKATGPSVVLVTMDTTRADRIGCYGHEAAETPVLDAMAAQGWRFERAYTSVPLTTPAHATILSGLYPTRHGIHTNGDAVLPESVETLAERLSSTGYRTAAAVSAFTTTSIWNFDQGFEAYFEEIESAGMGGRWGRERPAGPVVDDALGWLGELGDEPFFLWAHFFDPHHPYAPPEPFSERFAQAPYDGEIAYMDQQIGRLVEAVEARGGPVIWVFVGDHGEALGLEHGERTHGLFLFDPTTHVPLIIRGAEARAEGAVVGETVSTADLLPTILGLAGLEAPADLDGRDLGPLLRGEPLEHPGAYMESYTALSRFGYHPEIAWAYGGHKLMATPSPLLFDLVADPGETTNLLPDAQARADALRVPLDAVRAQKVASEAVGPAPEIAEQLAALGYMDGGFELDPDAMPTIDAKDRLGVISELERLRIIAGDPKRAEEVVAAYQAIRKREPGLIEANLGLSQALGRAGRRDEAIQVLEEALKKQPDSTVLMGNLANLLAASGRHQDGLALMEAILAAVPRDDLARVGVLRMLTDLKREQEALSRAQTWLADDPNDGAIQAHVGVLLVKLSRLSEAEPVLLSSLEDGVPRELVHRSLAAIYLDRGELPKAVRHLRAELEHFPGQRDVRVMLAELLGQLGAWDEVAAEYAFLAESKDPEPMWTHNHAQAVFNTGDYERAAEIIAPMLDKEPPLPEALLLQANILAKQGKRDEGKVLFERAQALKQAQLEGAGQ
jgi:arylsulfatase A-like enzyme/tetratricopeptide (TPR) repeat protein